MDEKKYLAIICGDWNDGDYVYNILHVDWEEASKLIVINLFIESVLKELKSINAGHKVYLDKLCDLLNEIVTYDYDLHKWVYTYKCEDENFEEPEYLYLSKLPKEDLFAVMDFCTEYMPSGYECSCHSLVSIEIYETASKVY